MIDKKTHEFKSLARAERELKSEIDELLKDASDRVTKLCQSEKHAWSVVDKLESDSEKMISRVLRRMNKQVTHSLTQSVCTSSPFNKLC